MERFLLYPAMGLYVLAGVIHLARARKAGTAVFALGTLLNLSASIMRGVQSGHLPFSNMFETMMTLGACMFLFFLFSEFVLESRTGWIDPLLGAVILFPACFIFEDEIKPLPPALRSNLFFPHVTSYLVAYAAMAKAMILSIISLAKRRGEEWKLYEKAAYRITGLGFPFLTTGLLLGAVWAQRAWGDYWSWDPKEIWSLNTWFIYLIYFHLRIRGGRASRWVDVANIFGFLAIVVTLLAVNLAGIFGGGLHSYV